MPPHHRKVSEKEESLEEALKLREEVLKSLLFSGELFF